VVRAHRSTVGRQGTVPRPWTACAR
jgi:hypothetical protein